MINWKDAKVHVLSNGLHYGSGVFEGIRCYAGPEGSSVFRLRDHIKRLFYSAKCLEIKIPYTQKELETAVLETIRNNNLKECYIRPVAFCGYGKPDLDTRGSAINTAVITFPLKVILGNSGVSAIISHYRRLSPKSVPIDAKINGYYVNSIITSLEAKKKNALKK